MLKGLSDEIYLSTGISHCWNDKVHKYGMHR